MCVCVCTTEHISAVAHTTKIICPCLLDTKDICCPAAFVCWQSGTLRGQPAGRSGSELLDRRPLQADPHQVFSGGDPKAASC